MCLCTCIVVLFHFSKEFSLFITLGVPPVHRIELKFHRLLEPPIRIYAFKDNTFIPIRLLQIERYEQFDD